LKAIDTLCGFLAITVYHKQAFYARRGTGRPGVKSERQNKALFFLDSVCCMGYIFTRAPFNGVALVSSGSHLMTFFTN
jgi:hypothetical protein